jgi:glyoxylase-like metal-dependent hydrolase (beta-lactamase superfamily II)
MEKNEYVSTLVEPKVWHIADYRNDSMYLIEGEKESILFDTGMGEGDLRFFVENITKNPLKVVISHAHWDHIMQIDQFDEVYMNHKDFKIVQIFSMNIKIDRIKDIKDGETLDLGDRKLEVIEVPGHTPGSIVLLDKENKLLFSGDALGAGHTWLQLPGCLPLTLYLQSLYKLRERIGEFEKIYNGHLPQCNMTPYSSDYLLDLIKAVEKVIFGELKGEPYPYGNFGGLYVTYGKAVLVYNPDNIR